MSVTAPERETIILTSDEDSEWTVYTCQQKIMTKMKKIGAEPYKTEKDSNGNVIANYYKIDFKQVSFRSPSQKREMTEEQKQKVAERLQRARNNK